MDDLILFIYLGNRETAASLLDMRTSEYRHLEILPGRNTIYSALAVVQNSKGKVVYIGHDALAHIADASYFLNCFADDIDLSKPENREVVTCFLENVHDGIRRSLPELIARPYNVVLITPLREKEQLRNLVLSVGIPVDQIVDNTIAISRVAIYVPDTTFRIRYNRMLFIEFKENQTEFTLFKKENIVDRYTFDIGFSFIVKELYHYILSLHDDTVSLLQGINECKVDLETEQRLLSILSYAYYKNTWFKNNIFSFTLDFAILTNGKHHGIKVYNLEREQLESILSDFVQRLSNLLNHVKNEIRYNEREDYVVLLDDRGVNDTVRDVFFEHFNDITTLPSDSPLYCLDGMRWLEDWQMEMMFDKQINYKKTMYNMNTKPITEQTEFIIGIDFGHGETSACFYGLHDEKSMDLHILPGKKVIKSAVAVSENDGHETTSIGDVAWQNASSSDSFRVSFKKRPSEMSQNDRKLMRLFMRGVYNGILTCNPDFKKRDHRVFIARPSSTSWDSEEDEYLKIAIEAGLPVAGIHRESRAAFFLARVQPDAKINNDLQTGVLIVDFGSSTIDLTYLNEGLKKPIDDGFPKKGGYPVGASTVEKLLLDYSLNHPNQGDIITPKIRELCCDEKATEDEVTKEERANVYNQLLLAFRNAKEDFYSNRQQQPVFSVIVDYGRITSGIKQHIFGLASFYYSVEDIERIIKKYIDEVEAAIRQFKDEKLGNGNPVACVYLTGGASSMDFVRKIMMRVFSLPENKIPGDSDPSLIVSRGVARLSYADLRSEELACLLRDKRDNLLKEFKWEETLRDIICRQIKSDIISEAEKIMEEYKKPDGKYCEAIYADKVDNLHKGRVVGVEHKYYDENGNMTHYKVYNIKTLIKFFKEKFASYEQTDFALQDQESIRTELIDKINESLMPLMDEMAVESDKWMLTGVNVTGLKATINKDGIEKLTNRFCGEGEGHIIYDAVKSCYIGGTMLSFDRLKDRWASDRNQHYNYYMENYHSILSNIGWFNSSYSWDNFFKKNVNIEGIKSARVQVEDYIRKSTEELISYARLKNLL